MKTVHDMLAMIGGLAMWALLVLRYLSPYRGSQAFYLIAQREKGLPTTLARAVLDGPLGRKAVDYSRYQEAVDLDRISPVALEQYSDDSLMGYGDDSIAIWEGWELTEQQRGLILPLLDRALGDLPAGSSVVEIGTGNGDVIAHLAERWPELSFTGVDLSVKTAERKHGDIRNLSFVKGYALDLLESGDLKGDLVFGSSTFIIFTPLELRAYVRALRNAGFSQVVLNEPTWGGLEQTKNGDTSSWHLEGATWHHNYAGYLSQEGYSVRDFDFSPYQHPLSPRPDIHLLLMRAERAASG